jgi:hypothetical protein
MAFSWVVGGLAAIFTTYNIAWVLIFSFSYYLVLALYRISPWHPLSHIPGPKLAAMTLLYEFWYDMVLGGTYTQVIRRMHEDYGEDPHVTGPCVCH